MSDVAPVAHWYRLTLPSEEAERLHIAPMRRARLTDLRMEGHEMYQHANGDGTTSLLQRIPGPAIAMQGWTIVERPDDMRHWHKLS